MGSIVLFAAACRPLASRPAAARAISWPHGVAAPAPAAAATAASPCPMAAGHGVHRPRSASAGRTRPPHPPRPPPRWFRPQPTPARAARPLHESIRQPGPRWAWAPSLRLHQGLPLRTEAEPANPLSGVASLLPPGSASLRLCASASLR